MGRRLPGVGDSDLAGFDMLPYELNALEERFDEIEICGCLVVRP